METQGSLCSKRLYHLLFLIIRSKGEKSVFWMGKTKQVRCQAVWNFDDSYWQSCLEITPAQHLGSLAPKRHSILACQEMPRTFPSEVEIGYRLFWWELVGLGGWSAQLSHLIHGPGNSEWTSFHDHFGQFYSLHHKMPASGHLNQAKIFSVEKITIEQSPSFEVQSEQLV